MVFDGRCSRSHSVSGPRVSSKFGLPGTAEEVGYNLLVAEVDSSVWRRPVMKLCSLIIDGSRFLS